MPAHGVSAHHEHADCGDSRNGPPVIGSRPTLPTSDGWLGVRCAGDICRRVLNPQTKTICSPSTTSELAFEAPSTAGPDAARAQMTWPEYSPNRTDYGRNRYIRA